MSIRLMVYIGSLILFICIGGMLYFKINTMKDKIDTLNVENTKLLEINISNNQTIINLQADIKKQAELINNYNHKSNEIVIQRDVKLNKIKTVVNSHSQKGKTIENIEEEVNNETNKIFNDIEFITDNRMLNKTNSK